VLPKSTKEERRRENMDLLDWKLGKEEMLELDNMEKVKICTKYRIL
jgi:diketogulonate reductase-like aldo/keto reductase